MFLEQRLLGLGCVPRVRRALGRDRGIRLGLCTQEARNLVKTEPKTHTEQETGDRDRAPPHLVQSQGFELDRGENRRRAAGRDPR